MSLIMGKTFLELKEREEVCEKVLGLVLTARRDDFTLWYHPEEEECFKSGDTSVLFETPSFTTYEEFGQIFEAMKARGFEVEMASDGIVGEWEVCFGKKLGQDPTWTASHPNLATAAAKAALMTVGEE